MKKIALLALLIATVACTQLTIEQENKVQIPTDNIELKALYEDDQNDRKKGNADWVTIAKLKGQSAPDIHPKLCYQQASADWSVERISASPATFKL